MISDQPGNLLRMHPLLMLPGGQRQLLQGNLPHNFPVSVFYFNSKYLSSQYL